MTRTVDMRLTGKISLMICVVAAVLLVAWPHSVAAGAPGEERVRKAAVAGQFYPSEREELLGTVTRLMDSAKRQTFSEPVRAILAPHAGYDFCGRTMAAAYKQIEGPAFQYDTVILIGPSHGFATAGAAVSSATVWETPLGPVKVDREACRRFVETSDRIEFDDRPHAQEHSLEVQLPFLMVAARGKPFKVVPVVTSSSDTLDHQMIARALVQVASRQGTLIVVSSDFSHFPDAKAAEIIDKNMLSAIASLNAEILSQEDRKIIKAAHSNVSCTLCGLEAVLSFQRAAAALGITKAAAIDYSHSGTTTGDNKRVVGYGAMIFAGPWNLVDPKSLPLVTISLNDESRKELLSMVRAAVKAAVQGDWVSYLPSANPELQIKAGCFVTLKNRGKLRGCIGGFKSDAPLWKTAREIAVLSATNDARFAHERIKPEEVPELQIEVSILSPMRRVSRPLEEIQLGRDGIVVQDKGQSGTFLPQVATETVWSLEEFLGHCSRDKAGLSWEGWKSPTAVVYAYTATIVSE